jgi:nucleoside-diphosphate-sugar epimerase
MILVTGANGFIGSYLVKSLVNIFGKDRILALTSHPIEPCNYLLHNNYNFDSNIFVKNGFEGIETIIHAGAFTPKLSSDSNNIEGSFSNINGTHKLISASYPNLKRIIFLSTIDVYGDDNPITETSPVIPISLYGHSKLYCEEMIKAWADKMNISSTILRIGHVYGPGEEKYKKLIPIVFQKILSGEQIRIFGNGRDIRTFIFISDVVCAIIRSVELKSKDEIINVVGDEQVSINDLIEKIIHISERDVTIVHDQMVGKVRNMVFDNIKMVKLLCPLKVSLNEGLKSEWEYFAKNEYFL